MEENKLNKTNVDESRSHFNGRVFLGLILVVLGGIFLLDNMNIINFNVPRIIFSWPSYLIIIGLIILARSRNKIVGAGFVIAGALFLLPRIFPWIQYDEGRIFVPLILILLGIYILVRRNSSRSLRGCRNSFNSKGNINTDRIDVVSIFGGGERTISSNNFQGGNVTSIFGGSEIDLTNSKLAPGKNIIDVLCLFGGTTIVVPKDWNVITDVFALFGGFSNKGLRNSDEVNQEKMLIIKGVALFGGGEVKKY